MKLAAEEIFPKCITLVVHLSKSPFSLLLQNLCLHCIVQQEIKRNNFSLEKYFLQLLTNFDYFSR